MSQRADVFCAQLLDNRGEQPFLAAEVGIERAFGAANVGDDPVNTDP